MKTFISVITFMLLISSFSLVDARRGSDDSGSDDSSSSSSSSSLSSSDDSDDDSDDSDDDNSSDDDSDDMVNGVKLRGDGSVDDDQPSSTSTSTSSGSSSDDMVNGVKLRGDGSVDDNGVRQNRGRVLGERHVNNFDNKVNTLIDVLLVRGTTDEQDIQLLEDAMDKIVGKIDSLMLRAQSVTLKNKLVILREMTVEKFDEAIVNLQGEIDSILDSIVN